MSPTLCIEMGALQKASASTVNMILVYTLERCMRVLCADLLVLEGVAPFAQLINWVAADAAFLAAV